MIRIFLLIILFFYFAYGEYRDVKVGHIDKYYQNKITTSELKNIIAEVEKTLESQVGHQLFGIDPNGVEINLVYVKPSIAKNSLDRKINRYEKKIKVLENLEKELLNLKDTFENMNKKYQSSSEILNKKIKTYNYYVKNLNENRSLSHSQFQKMKQKALQEESQIKKEQKKLKTFFKKLKSLEREHNRKVNKYNHTIQSSQDLARQIERISHDMKIVKGNAFFNKEIEKKIYTQNNKVIKTDIKETMKNKIEIYSYDSYGELRAVIAHEIGHLIGLPHISASGALMNPILQKNQVEKLELTKEDIKNIKNNF